MFPFLSLQGRGGPGMTANVGRFFMLSLFLYIVINYLVHSFTDIFDHVFLFSHFYIKDPQKQIGIPAVQGEAAQHQPIGLHIAITAATVMTAALGGAQSGIQPNQNGMQSQSALTNDPLTLHLAKMSRSQLTEIISELKVNIW